MKKFGKVKIKYLQIKQRFWFFILETFYDKKDEGKELNWFLKFLYKILFPVIWARYSEDNFNSYSYHDDTWYINGKRISGILLRQLVENKNNGYWFRIVDGEKDTVTIQFSNSVDNGIMIDENGNRVIIENGIKKHTQDSQDIERIK